MDKRDKVWQFASLNKAINQTCVCIEKRPAESRQHRAGL